MFYLACEVCGSPSEDYCERGKYRGGWAGRANALRTPSAGFFHAPKKPRSSRLQRKTAQSRLPRTENETEKLLRHIRHFLSEAHSACLGDLEGERYRSPGVDLGPWRLSAGALPVKTSFHSVRFRSKFAPSWMYSQKRRTCFQISRRFSACTQTTLVSLHVIKAPETSTACQNSAQMTLSATASVDCLEARQIIQPSVIFSFPYGLVSQVHFVCVGPSGYVQHSFLASSC